MIWVQLMEVSLTEILTLISMQLGVERIRSHHRFREDLGAQSFDIQNLVRRIERRYGLEIGEEDLALTRTVAELHELVNRKLLAGP